ncbi:MAG: glutamate--tRNA ligase [Candidatus Micrarchaeia archaeon]
MDKEAKKIIRKLAIKNAFDYGKADFKAVLGKAIAKVPGAKENMKLLSELVNEIVGEVNLLAREEIEKEYGKYEEEFKEEEKKKLEESKPKLDLPGAVVGEFATRFPPEPSGYMHIGHAKVAYLEDEFAKIYKGKLFLYFDDTNPEKESQEYVDAFKRDLEWLGIKFDGEYYASDHLEEIYKYAKELIKKGKAYVCTCNPETIKRNRFNGIACIHRDHSIEENMKLFEDMLSGKFNEGEAVLRFKGDLKSQNTVMRDPTLIRIKKTPHYRQGKKYILWPTYDMNTPIMDSIHGITDVIRSKEYELRTELDLAILEELGLRKPRIHHEARLAIRDIPTQKRVINKLIKEGIVKGFDDPRLVTVAALRRRGIRPEAIRKFVLRFGMSRAESYMDINMLLDENRKIIDSSAKRLFAVLEPVELEVKDAGNVHVKLRLHPTADLGYREYEVGNKLYISRKDAEKLGEGRKVRLKDLYNIEVLERKGSAIIGRYIGNDAIDADKIQWVDIGNCTEITLISPKPLLKGGKINKESLETKKAIAEKFVERIKKDEVVQFERVGFFKLDDVEKKEFIEL